MQLREDSGEIYLVISDLGRGFDVEAASQGKGLGITSMRERIRLLNGTISIESKPMAGTTIHVRVPLSSSKNISVRLSSELKWLALMRDGNPINISLAPIRIDRG